MIRIHDKPATEGNRSRRACTLAPSFNAAVEGLSVLMTGQRGPAIVRLQRLLNLAGVKPPLEEDGSFGPRTDNAVRWFQRTYKGEPKLKVDGKTGPKTLAALADHLVAESASRGEAGQEKVSAGTTGGTRLPPPAAAATPAPTVSAGLEFAREPGRAVAAFAVTRGEGDAQAARITKAKRETQAEAIMRANGMWPPEKGRTYVIQIDQDSPPASASHQERERFLRTYTGQVVVFRAKGGHLIEQNPKGPFRSASHPGQMKTRSRMTPNIDNNGTRDIAHLRAGVYDYRAQPYRDEKGAHRFTPVSDWQMAVARDTNQDGVIDDDEAAARYRATGIEFHAGNNRGPSSVGCQTLQPSHFRTFRNLLPTGRSDTWTYILVRRPNDEFGAVPL